MTIGDRAFRFDLLQDELLQAALRRDGGTEQRWATIYTRYSLAEITARKVRRLLPLVERNLGSASDTIAGREILRDAYRSAAAAHDERVRWVEQLLTRLTDDGIEVLVLKGLALASAYYPEPALRPMVDVDVLVRPRDLQPMLRLVLADGWEPRTELAQGHIRRRRELDLRGPAREKLDLHWHVHPAFVRPGTTMSDTDQFFARSRHLTVGTASTRMLDPTDNFVHLLVHGAHVGWRMHPLWVPDAVTILGREALDGERLLSLVRTANVALPVARGVAYLSARFDCRPRFTGDSDSLHEVQRLARRPLIRQRRIYAQISVRPPEPPPWLQRLLGPFAYTYNYWATQTGTWTRRRAFREFPGWLADTWKVRGPRALPGAAWARLKRRTSHTILRSRRAPGGLVRK